MLAGTGSRARVHLDHYAQRRRRAYACEPRVVPGGGGADYMLLWTSVLEGPNDLGDDFNFVYFVGPQDFAGYFALDGGGDIDKIDQLYDKRLKSDPDFENAAQGGLTRSAFRNYYALKASTSYSRGAHDEWNIIRMVNERRRSDNKLGVANHLLVLFDGKIAPAAAMESAVSGGYVGKCALSRDSEVRSETRRFITG